VKTKAEARVPIDNLEPVLEFLFARERDLAPDAEVSQGQRPGAIQLKNPLQGQNALQEFERSHPDSTAVPGSQR
jgi:hypothetical protein